MPQVFGFGNTLVSPQRLAAMSREEVTELVEAKPSPGHGLAKPSILAALGNVRGGIGNAANVRIPGVPGLVEAEPIALAKPVSVEIAFVHTGSLSNPGFLGSRPDFLLTSAVKRGPAIDEAPRALNALIDRVDRGLRFDRPPATRKGTPLVYHAKSLTDRGIDIQIDMIFSRFDSTAFEAIANLLQTAAGIPVFAPASTYLMAGSVVTKLAGRAIESIVDGKPSFSERLSLDMGYVNRFDTLPGFVVLTNSAEFARQIDQPGYAMHPEKGIVDANEAPVETEAAYVVMSLYGNERPDYEGFTASLLTATMLNKFLHVGENQPTPTGLLLDSFKAYNDLYFRRQAEGLIRKYKAAVPDSDKAKELKKLIDAYIGNIEDETLKPAVEG